jgi:hypothetical protein
MTTGAIHMRNFCVVLAIVAMPLSAGAQQHQRPAQPPPASLGSIGLPLPAIGLPATVNYPKPWEWTVPAPAWERAQLPPWERKDPPAWERGPRPSQPIARPDPDRHRPSYQGPGVVYVMQPYPVPQPYPVYIEVPAPPAPEPPPAPPEEPPPAPVMPTGSRTLYVIPGCYLGNVLPDVSRLPAGCDISRMKTHTP